MCAAAWSFLKKNKLKHFQRNKLKFDALMVVEKLEAGGEVTIKLAGKSIEEIDACIDDQWVKRMTSLSTRPTVI